MTHEGLPDGQAQRFTLYGVNWPLVLGGIVVLLVLYLALDGPRLAPRDPMQENFVIENPATGKFVTAPFPAFIVPGFPLGSDEFGRDLFSRLLWAVRPTMVLVLVVAAIRLIFGISVGLASGWSVGMVGRILDSVIAGALAAPVLFIALCIIAAVGLRLGLWAFIIGLSVTGWADAARFVRGQTRLVSSQPYIEAARALGASDVQLVARHVLLQVMPMMWTLLAFEISNALLTTAALGFLGYFTNAIWVPIGDFVGLRVSGRPELGQMLSSVTQAQDRPWGALAAGSMVFVTVLGFNLLGEGLRLQFSPEVLRRRKGAVGQAVEHTGAWIEDRLFDPLSPWRRAAPTVVAIASLLFIVIGGGYTLWRLQDKPQSVVAIPMPGGHLWATELHDACGALWANANGPTKPKVTWVFYDQSGLSGGPAVSADGTVYVTSKNARLHALSPDGRPLWGAELLAAPVGVPALGASGDIYVTDSQGGLSALGTDGVLRWTVPGGAKDSALSGPVVSPDNTIYYPTTFSLIAVSPQGQVMWVKPLPTFSYSSPLPRLSPNGEFLFFEDMIVDAKTGDVIAKETAELDKYLVGTNGNLYLRTQAVLMELTSIRPERKLVQRAKWDTRALNLGFHFTRETGVTPDGHIWMFYDSGLAWLNPDGQLLSVVDYPYWSRGPTRLVAIGQDDTVFTCGIAGSYAAAVECQASRLSGVPLWRLSLGKGRSPIGGALVPGRLYVATVGGYLYALEDE